MIRDLENWKVDGKCLTYVNKSSLTILSFPEDQNKKILTYASLWSRPHQNISLWYISPSKAPENTKRVFYDLSKYPSAISNILYWPTVI